jgi:rubrerythrin
VSLRPGRLAELLAEAQAAVVICWACDRAQQTTDPPGYFVEDKRGRDDEPRKVCPTCAEDPGRFKRKRPAGDC